MRKLTTGLLIAASALALAGCGKTEEAPVAAEATTEAAAASTDDAAAASATDAAATSTEAGDPNNNPVRP